MKLFFHDFTTPFGHSVPQKGAKDVMITEVFSLYTSTSFLFLPALFLHLLLAQRNLPAVTAGDSQLPCRLSSLSLLRRGSLYRSSSALPPPIRLTGTSLCPILGQDSRSRVSLRWQIIPILMSSVITMTNDTSHFDRLLVFGYTLFTPPFPHIRNKQCCLLKRVNNSPLLLGFYPKQQLDVVKW